LAGHHIKLFSDLFNDSAWQRSLDVGSQSPTHFRATAQSSPICRVIQPDLTRVHVISEKIGKNDCKHIYIDSPIAFLNSNAGTISRGDGKPTIVSAIPRSSVTTAERLLRATCNSTSIGVR